MPDDLQVDLREIKPLPLTWAVSCCRICRVQFDYIKQDRMPIPDVCRKCNP